MLNLSYSKISDFLTCPKKYELINIKKVLPEEKENIHSAFGSAIHYSIEQSLNKDVDFDLMIIFFKKKFDELFENIPCEKRQLIFKQEWYLKAEQMLNYFYKKIYDLAKSGKVETENYFSYEFEKDVFLKGLIDFVFRIDNKIELWDWKTGKKLSLKDNLQLRIYAYCYYKLFNKLPVNLRYIFLKAHKENLTEMNEEILNCTENELKDIIKNIKNKIIDNKFEKCNNYMEACRYCSVRKFCEKEK